MIIDDNGMAWPMKQGNTVVDANIKLRENKKLKIVECFVNSINWIDLRFNLFMVLVFCFFLLLFNFFLVFI